MTSRGWQVAFKAGLRAFGVEDDVFYRGLYRYDEYRNDIQEGANTLADSHC